MRRFVDVGGGGLDEVEIHQAILVIVDGGHSSAHGFEVILFVGLGGVLLEGDAGGRADVGEVDGGIGLSGYGCCHRQE